MGVVVAGRPRRAYPAPLRGVCMQRGLWVAYMCASSVPLRGIFYPERTLPPACICLSQGRGETTLTRRSWRLEAQPSQLHFPNYPKSFKFGFRRRKQEIQKNPRNTSIIYIQKKKKQTERFIRDA